MNRPSPDPTPSDLQARLRACERRVQALFDRSVAGAFESTLGGEILFVNDAFARIFGYDDPEALLSRQATDLYEDPEDREAFLERLRSEGSVAPVEFRGLRKDGTRIWLRENAMLVRDRTRDEPLVVGTVMDITEQKRKEKEGERAELEDPLTGLANRRLLEERTDQAITVADRQGERLALLFVDILRFKRVNDTLGHDAGDDILQEVARRIEERLRVSDTAARISGDQFAVLLGRVDAADGAVRLARELAERVRRPMEIRGREITLDLRIGVAVFPAHGRSFDTLLSAAETAMREGIDEEDPGGVVVFDPSEDPWPGDVLAEEKALRDAIEEGQLSFFYQPIYRVEDGTLAGYEALLRWNRPGRGLVPASDFLPLARRLGLMTRIDEWGVETALEALARHSDTDVPFLAVNLSANTLRDPAATERLAERLRESSVEEGRLMLEIDEGALIEAGERTLEALRALRPLGAAIALDHFGTGPSTLVFLEDLPVDYLKMDGSFLQNLDPEPGEGTMAEAIIRLGEGLGLRVIAVWVEEQDQREWLERIGGHHMQGYALGEPRPDLGPERP